MTEVQAAIGRYQLKKLTTWVNMRNYISKKIISICKNFKSIKTQIIPSKFLNSYLGVIFFELQTYKKRLDAEKILQYLNTNGIYCDVGSCPEIYKEKFLSKQKHKI